MQWNKHVIIILAFYPTPTNNRGTENAGKTSVCKIERPNVISAYNVYTNKNLGIMVNVLSRNVIQTYMGPF